MVRGRLAKPVAKGPHAIYRGNHPVALPRRRRLFRDPLVSDPVMDGLRVGDRPVHSLRGGNLRWGVGIGRVSGISRVWGRVDRSGERNDGGFRLPPFRPCDLVPGQVAKVSGACLSALRGRCVQSRRQHDENGDHHRCLHPVVASGRQNGSVSRHRIRLPLVRVFPRAACFLHRDRSRADHVFELQSHTLCIRRHG